nr:thioredoxin family protein [Blattabacterium cuenoti]
MKNFELLEVNSGMIKNLNEFFSKIANVIMFICNHCPYVKHINKELVNLSNFFIPKGISFIAINSNDIKQYPEDSPENMKKTSIKLEYPFPYFFDEKQEAAKYFGAKCTPEFFVFLGNGKLCYHGQLDNSRPGNQIPTTGHDVKHILNKILTRENINEIIIKPSSGCNIKWKQ